MRPGWLVATAVVSACTRNVVEDPSKPGSFPERSNPVSIPAEGIGLVTDFGSDQVSVIDLQGNVVSGQRSVVVDPIAQDGPHHIQTDATRGAAYVPLAFPAPSASPGPHAALTTIPGILLKLALKDLSIQGKLTVDVAPGDVKLTPDGSKLLVSHFDLARVAQALATDGGVDAMRATVMIVDTASLQPQVDATLCAAPNGLDVTPDGTTAYVACYGEDAIGVVHLDAPDLTTNPAGTIERFPVGPSPGQPGNPAYGPYAVVSSGAQLYVVERDAKQIAVIDLPSRQVLRTIALPGAPVWLVLAPTANQAIVSTQGTDGLSLVDLSAGSVLASRSFAGGTCSQPDFVATFRARYFVVCKGDATATGEVREIDPNTLGDISSFSVGVEPDAIAFVGGSP